MNLYRNNKFMLKISNVIGLAIPLAFSGSASAAFLPVDLSGIVNAPFSGEINGSTFPTGNATYNGVPFDIANIANGNNFWTGGGSTSAPAAIYSTTLTFSNIPKVANVYSMINTLWGTTNVTNPTPLSITFDAGHGGASYTKNLVGNVDVRDYNLLYLNTINGTTTMQAFTNGRGQVLDMQDYALPSHFLTDGLASVTLTENGAPGYEKAMFNALTLQTSPVSEPREWVLLTSGLGLLGFLLHRRKKELS